MAFKSFFTDDDFIEGIRNNDESALKTLYKRHFQMIANMVTNNSGTYQDAKDIYQESFIILYHNLRKTDFKLESQLKTYIYAICKRLWLNELKYKSRQSVLNDETEVHGLPESGMEQMVEEHEDKFNTMHQSLEELGEPCSEIIKDFYLTKCSMEEIAQKMGYTNADNAKSQKYKCLQRLKKIYFRIFNERRRND